jgi:hypothetical protein
MDLLVTMSYGDTCPYVPGRLEVIAGEVRDGEERDVSHIED